MDNTIELTPEQQREKNIMGMVGALQHFMAACDEQHISWPAVRAAAENMFELRFGKDAWECGKVQTADASPAKA